MTTRHAVAILVAFAGSMALTSPSSTMGACYKWNNNIGCCTAQHPHIMDDTLRCQNCGTTPKYVNLANAGIQSYEVLPSGSGTQGWNPNNFIPNGSPSHLCRFKELDCDTCKYGEPEPLPCQNYNEPTGDKDCTA